MITLSRSACVHRQGLPAATGLRAAPAGGPIWPPWPPRSMHWGPSSPRAIPPY